MILGFLLGLVLFLFNKPLGRLKSEPKTVLGNEKPLFVWFPAEFHQVWIFIAGGIVILITFFQMVPMSGFSGMLFGFGILITRLFRETGNWLTGIFLRQSFVSLPGWSGNLLALTVGIFAITWSLFNRTIFA